MTIELYKIYINTYFNATYCLREYKGKGAFGVVYLADEVIANEVNRQVALKAINRDDKMRLGNILREFKLATNLNHPHLLRCFNPVEGQLYNPDLKLAQLGIKPIPCLGLVMEVASGTLTQYIEAAGGKLPETEVLEILQGLASALEYLHSQKQPIVHQDLKPDNILRVGERWKLSDFGISRVLSDGSVDYTNPMGTARYSPPEAIESGAVTPAWDVWSLGVLGVELLTGQHPFPAKTLQELQRKILYLPPQIDSPLADPFGKIIAGCLNKDRKQRWTAKQVLEALKLSYPLKHQNYQEQLPGGVVLEMIAIPEGTFWMGSPDGEGSDLERPQHEVNVSKFWMGKTPITQEQWQAVMGNNPSHFQGAKRPVECVSWDNAQAFCEKLSKLSGRGYRLPSEAEWEYACRAGTRTSYCYGNDASQLGEYAWHGGNSGWETHPVGQKKANGWGLYDMHGNVWEWCEDDWHENYKGAPRDGSAWIDAKRSEERLLRGGSWADYAAPCRSANRLRSRADDWYYLIGFRVVVS